MTWAWQRNYVTLSTGERIRYALMAHRLSDLLVLRPSHFAESRRARGMEQSLQHAAVMAALDHVHVACGACLDELIAVSRQADIQEPEIADALREPDGCAQSLVACGTCSLEGELSRLVNIGLLWSQFINHRALVGDVRPADLNTHFRYPCRCHHRFPFHLRYASTNGMVAG